MFLYQQTQSIRRIIDICLLYNIFRLLHPHFHPRHRHRYHHQVASVSHLNEAWTPVTNVELPLTPIPAIFSSCIVREALVSLRMYSFMGGGLFCAIVGNILLVVSTATDYWMQYRLSGSFAHQGLWRYCMSGKCYMQTDSIGKWTWLLKLLLGNWHWTVPVHLNPLTWIHVCTCLQWIPGWHCCCIS